MDIPPSDSELRAAYHRGATAGDGCPSADELAALAAGSIDGAARERLLAHVARCADCADDLRLVLPARPAPVRRAGWRPLAVAAVLAVGVPLVAWWAARDEAPGTVYRTGVEREAPRAALADGAALPRAAFVLRWQPVAGAAAYDVVVADAALAPLHEARGVRGTEVTVPAGVLPEQGFVLWRVEAVMPDGSRHASPLYRATLR